MMSVVNRGGVWSIFRRVYALLTQKERRFALVVLLSVFLNSVVDIIGLAAIVPVIGLAVKPELLHSNVFIARGFELANEVGITSEQEFLIFISVLLVIVFGIKVCVGILVSLFQARFSFAVTHRLSGLMWTYHFSQSLESIRGQHSGRVLAEINSWPGGFAGTFMLGSLRLMTECIVVGALFIGLLVYSPIVLLGVASLVLAGTFLVRRVTRKRMLRYGNYNKELGPKSNSMINNALRGVLEVLSFGAEHQVRQSYLSNTKFLYRIAGNSQVLNTMPAKTYELLAVLGVCSAIVICLSLDSGTEEFFELLSLMTISAYRIMPSISRVNNIVMAYTGGYHLLKAMEKGVLFCSRSVDGRALERELKGEVTGIELEGLSLGYDSGGLEVFSGLSYFFKSGGIHAIVGPSGSGKTTLLNGILGIHRPTEGKVRIECGGDTFVLGEDLVRDVWLKKLGFLSQDPFFFAGTVRENMTFGIPGREFDEVQFTELAIELGLWDCFKEEGADFLLNEGGTNLSGGQRQRLALIRSLQLNSAVLVLDEATSALDIKSREKVFGLLKSRAEDGGLVLIVTHDIELAASCDSILNLSK